MPIVYLDACPRCSIEGFDATDKPANPPQKRAVYWLRDAMKSIVPDAMNWDYDRSEAGTEFSRFQISRTRRALFVPIEANDIQVRTGTISQSSTGYRELSIRVVPMTHPKLVVYRRAIRNRLLEQISVTLAHYAKNLGIEPLTADITFATYFGASGQIDSDSRIGSSWG
jgi:hypothetical protein